jgi:hypothetical protein
MRAAGHILNWKDVMKLMDQAYEKLGLEAVSVTECAISNLKYQKLSNIPSYSDEDYDGQAMNTETILKRNDEILNWIIHHKLSITSSTMVINTF